MMMLDIEDAICGLVMIPPARDLIGGSHGTAIEQIRCGEAFADGQSD